MKNFLHEKVSPIIAFLIILIFGYFSLYWMNQVFEGYARDEMLVKATQQFEK